MAISERGPYVWVFLPNAADPVVAGVLAPSASAEGLAFRYADSYLARENAVSLGPELPLGTATVAPSFGHRMPSSIRDAMPDNWGRQVINRELGLDAEDDLPDIRYMLESGSDRVGALDFQESPHTYVPRGGGGTLSEIAGGAVAVDSEDASGPELTLAVRNTLTAAGGSQPKAYVCVDGRQWLAKFQTSYDRRSPLIKAERAALHIARQANIDVPDARLVRLEDERHVLLTERFDRAPVDPTTASGPSTRQMVLSGLTIAEEHRVSGASYPDLVERLRRLSAQPDAAGRELFRRLAFRIVMRIDDDHLRNVAFFWDGVRARFTPAFDLSPDLVSKPVGLTDLGDGSREFSIAALIKQHRFYHLPRSDAREIANEMVAVVIDHREDAAEVAQMLPHEREMLITRTATPTLLG